MPTKLLQKLVMVLLIVLTTACASREPVPPVYGDYEIGFLGDLHTAMLKPASRQRGGSLSAAAYSPDGQRAAVANKSNIWLLDPNSNSLEEKFSGRVRPGTNNTLVFVGNNHLASTGIGSVPGTAAVHIWDLRSSPAVMREVLVPELDPYVISLAWSEANGLIAAGGENGNVVLLELDDEGDHTRKKLPGLGYPVLALEFSIDGTLVGAGGAGEQVLIWDTQTLAQSGALPVEGQVTDMEVIPGQQSLLVAGKNLGVWKYLTGDALGDLENPSVAGDAVAVAAGIAVLTVVVLAAGAAGGPAPSFGGGGGPVPDYGFCNRVTAVSPDGTTLVDAHPGIVKEKIRIIDLATTEVVNRINPRGSGTCGLAFSPDGTKIIISNQTGAFLYDTHSWEFEVLALN